MNGFINGINRAVTSFFDVVLTPLEAVGDEFALLVTSGVFGVLALFVFKHISWQRGIKRTKDKIKGHLIAIRLYQNDLGIVSKSIGCALLRNAQYLALNLGPFIPLSIPFALVAAQMVVRYGFEPAPIQHAQSLEVAGEGQTLVIEGSPEAIAGLSVDLPSSFTRVSPLARAPRHGNAAIEFTPDKPGTFDIVITPGGGADPLTKSIVVGPSRDARAMQDKRVTGLVNAVLWPAEDTLGGTGLTSVSFNYPVSDLGWLPFSGPVGVLLVFVLASMLIGFLFLKPLGVQI